MTENHSSTHKHTRTSQEWGEEYSYFERRVQKQKAHELLEAHHHARRKLKHG